jgi:hypothetical protein
MKNKKVKSQYFDRGITVEELLSIISDWPKLDSNGDPNEVWIETGWCLSSVVVEVSPLNKRINDDGSETAYILLSSAAFEG